jgi:hypothetical protein
MRKVPPVFGVIAAEVAVVPLVPVLPGADWEVELPPGCVPEVCVDVAVVVVDPPLQAASRSVLITRRLTTRMTGSLMRDFIGVLPLELR